MLDAHPSSENGWQAMSRGPVTQAPIPAPSQGMDATPAPVATKIDALAELRAALDAYPNIPTPKGGRER